MYYHPKFKTFLEKMTNKVIEKTQKKNSLPWKWDDGLFSKGTAVSHNDGHEYRGGNRFILNILSEGSNEWVTLFGANKEKGSILEGSSAVPICFYWLEDPDKAKKGKGKGKKQEAQKEDKGEEAKKKSLVPRWKVYYMYEVGVSTKGITPKYNIQSNEEPPKLERAEAFIKNFFEATNLGLVERMGTPAYSPSRHLVKLPPRTNFKSAERFYETIFHEMAHSTGKALKRKMEVSFGSESYSLEEIVAEFTCSMLLYHFGIVSSPEEANNPGAYIAGWLKAFRDNPEWLFEGGKLAEKAFAYMLEKGGEVIEESPETKETTTKAKAKPKTSTVEVNATAA